MKWVKLAERAPQVDYIDSRKDWAASDILHVITLSGSQAKVRYLCNAKTGDHIWQPVKLGNTYRNCDISMWCPAA